MSNRYSMEGLLEKRKANRVIFHGEHAHKVMSKVTSLNLSCETQQQDEELAEDIILNVYVVKPKQMGISDVAAMAANAGSDPDSTVMTVLPQEEGEEELTEDEKLTIQTVEKIIVDTGAHVFHDIDSSADYINQTGEGTLTSE